MHDIRRPTGENQLVQTLGRSDDRQPVFNTIARRIGLSLRDLYPNPETEPLPADLAQKLLELRQKERSRQRRG